MSKSKQEIFLNAYQDCHQAFARYCSALAYGKMDTEDLMQDIVLSTYEKFDRIKNKDQLLHYLIRSARNKFISKLRRERNKVAYSDKHAERLSAKGVSPETMLDIQLLYNSLDQLPIKQKEAIILYEINGFSMKEIAALQNSSEGAVKTKISRGRVKLKNIIENDAKANLNILNTIKSIVL